MRVFKIIDTSGVTLCYLQNGREQKGFSVGNKVIDSRTEILARIVNKIHFILIIYLVCSGLLCAFFPIRARLVIF